MGKPLLIENREKVQALGQELQRAESHYREAKIAHDQLLADPDTVPPGLCLQILLGDVTVPIAIESTDGLGDLLLKAATTQTGVMQQIWDEISTLAEQSREHLLSAAAQAAANDG